MSVLLERSCPGCFLQRWGIRYETVSTMLHNVLSRREKRELMRLARTADHLLDDIGLDKDCRSPETGVRDDLSRRLP